MKMKILDLVFLCVGVCVFVYMHLGIFGFIEVYLGVALNISK